LLRADDFSRYSVIMNDQNFFIYARKSTDDTSRQVRSIDDQIAELRQLAKRDGLHIVDVLIEKQTAKAPGRTIFNKMLDRIDKGEASGILAWHPDRLARNSLDGGRIIYLLDISKITELRFPTFWFEPTPQGKLMLSIAFGMSKYYVDNLSENIKRGQRNKIQSGIWPMMAPIGYLNERTTRGIIPDPRRAPLIRKAFELYAIGTYTIDRLQEKMNALGMIARNGEPLCRAQYHRILQNPIYCGIISYAGAEYEGKHEALVTKNLFDKVREVMTRKSKPKTPKLKPFLYRGLFRCGDCGCFVTTETQKGTNYLRCTKRVKKDCSQRYVREDIISNQIADYLAALAISGEDAEWMVMELETERTTDVHAREDSIRTTKSRLDHAEQKFNRLMDAYLDNTISLEEYRAAKSGLVHEKQGLKDEIAAVEQNRGSWFEPAIRFVNDLKIAGILAAEGNPVSQRDFLKKVGSNYTISDRHLSVKPRGAWQLVVDQGSFAQRNTAPEISGAVLAGETHAHLNKRCFLDKVRTFFKDNPTWE
jgi:site-specific DNA recombinase